MVANERLGQLGRVGVIGGSTDYTGAPYFSAMASARLGCDMVCHLTIGLFTTSMLTTLQSHVICTPEAAAVIKTYSPNLMVHPLMRQSLPAHDTGSSSTSRGGRHPEADPERIASQIADMLPRLHVIVIGPGLGRDDLMHATAARVVQAAIKAQIPVVIDADALQIVQKNPDLVKGYKAAVLTPNIVEFKRLCEALGVTHDSAKDTDSVEALAQALGGVTIVQKGGMDLVSNGHTTLANDLEGGHKRSGGQGDTLTGSIATFLGWRQAYLEGLWDHGDSQIDSDELLGLAAFGGSAITRASQLRCSISFVRV